MVLEFSEGRTQSQGPYYVVSFPQVTGLNTTKPEVSLGNQIFTSMMSQLSATVKNEEKILCFADSLKEKYEQKDYPNLLNPSTDGTGSSFENFKLIYTLSRSGEIQTLDILTSKATYTVNLPKYAQNMPLQLIFSDLVGGIIPYINQNLLAKHSIVPFFKELETNNYKATSSPPSANNALRVFEGFCKAASVVALLAVIGFIIAGTMGLTGSAESWAGAGISTAVGSALFRFGMFANEESLSNKDVVPESALKIS